MAPGYEMPCYKPLKGYRARTPEPSGKYRVVFNIKYGYADLPVTVPCGQCIGCKLERSKKWAARCVHEASTNQSNSFITLTFSDRYINPEHTLEKAKVSEFTKFVKRFRERIRPTKVSYFHCAEYGYQYEKDDHKKLYPIKDSLGRDLVGRPHHHALIFGYDFPDKVYYKDTPAGMPIYRSEILEGLWPFGYSSVGAITFESAAYVARYCVKKLNGERAEAKCAQGLRHYERLLENGEIVTLEPEYTTMSNGIGKKWMKLYEQEIIDHDSVVISGKEIQTPRYYLDQLPEDEFEKIKCKRIKAQKLRAHDNTSDRLESKEKVKLAQSKMLKRGL